MENRDTKMNCAMPSDNKFSKKFKALLYMGIFLTGVLSFMGVFMISLLLTEHTLWTGVGGQGINSMLWENLIFPISMMLCFVSLIRIAVTKKPFSKVLVNCLLAIGVVFIIGAMAFPFLPVYQEPHFVLLAGEGKWYIDGMPFVVGVLILIFSKLVQYGLAYQKEMDTIV